jgi:simple sugar transport system substrate-binding protein
MRLAISSSLAEVASDNNPERGRRTMKAVKYVLGLGTAVAALAAFWGTMTVASAQDACEGREKLFIYYATHAIPHPVWETVRRGAVRGAADNCLRLKWTQSDTFSVEDTINRMEAAVAEKPDMLVITATDPQAMRPTLEKAAADGIPVIAINVEDPAPKDERVPYLLYIGADMYLSGQEAAARVLSVRPDAKRAVCFHNAPGHVGLDAMCRGFLDGMKDGSGAPGEVVPVSFDISVSEATVSNYFTANPDTDALFTMDAGPAAFGALLEVVRRENRTDDVTLVTFDVSPLLLEAVESGETVAGIDQLMYMQGYLPAVLTRAYLDWGMIPSSDIITGPAVIDQSNIEAVKRRVMVDDLR